MGEFPFAQMGTVNFVKAVLICLYITITDYLPIWIKRRLYASEYSGDQLEKRISTRVHGGYEMFKLIYGCLCNAPKVSVREKIDSNLTLTELSTGKVFKLADLSRPGIPLVLNFGSCT